MPLVIKHHTVPHLKGLDSGLEPKTSCGRGSSFMGPMLALKGLILYHREANEQFAMLSIVCYVGSKYPYFTL